MPEMRINTESALHAAQTLKTINDQIEEGMSDANNEMSKLDMSWDGPTASAAISRYNTMRNQMNAERYKVIDNYVKFLMTQVGEGYEQTEDANVSLSSLFRED